MPDDETLAVAAMNRLGCLMSDQWPLIASFLVASGAESDGVVALASLTADASGWQIDQLVPEVLSELKLPDLSLDEAAYIMARLMAQGRPGRGNYPIIRALARITPQLDYPDGLLHEAYMSEEFLDCDCHPSGRREADALESQLQGQPPLRLPVPLALALLAKVA